MAGLAGATSAVSAMPAFPWHSDGAPGAHERVQRDALPVGYLYRALHALGTLDLQATAVEVVDDIMCRVEHGQGVGGAVPVLEVGAVVRDEQERAARRDRVDGRPQDG